MVFSTSLAYSQQSRTKIRVDFRVNRSTIDQASIALAYTIDLNRKGGRG